MPMGRLIRATLARFANKPILAVGAMPMAPSATMAMPAPPQTSVLAETVVALRKIAPMGSPAPPTVAPPGPVPVPSPPVARSMANALPREPSTRPTRVRSAIQPLPRSLGPSPPTGPHVPTVMPALRQTAAIVRVSAPAPT